MQNIQANSLPSTGKGGIILAGGLAVLSVASVALPIVSIKVLGFGSSLTLVSPILVGGSAYLLPLAFSAGLLARLTPQTLAYVRILEIAALVIAVAIALYASMTLLNGLNELSNADRQMTQMLGSGSAPQLARGVSVSSGTLALVLLALGSAWQVWTGRGR